MTMHQESPQSTMRQNSYDTGLHELLDILSYLGESVEDGKILDRGGRLLMFLSATLLCQDTVGLEAIFLRSSALPPVPAFLRIPPLALGELP